MTVLLKEYFNVQNGNVRIDREQGVIYDVKILGSVSRNKRVYPNETLLSAAPLYENAKVNLDHPEGDPRASRSYQDRFGMIRNIQCLDSDGLYGDFHFNPKHALAEQLLWDAENAPENVGFSHNVEAVVERSGDEDVVRRIVAVRSVDLVADPATTHGLFESAQDASKDDELRLLVESATYRNEILESVIRRAALLSQEIGESVRDFLSANFIETLLACDDRAKAEILLEDRAAMLRKLAVPAKGPFSREQFPARSHQDGLAAFLRDVRG